VDAAVEVEVLLPFPWLQVAHGARLVSKMQVLRVRDSFSTMEEEDAIGRDFALKGSGKNGPRAPR
jgi:hypothetical protein